MVHPDGGVWFTDPSYGIRGNYEGFKAESETKEAVYRADPKTGAVEKVTDAVDQPNGLCFSPDYKKLYVADTGMSRDIKVFDVDGKALRNGKRHAQLTIPGTRRAVGRRRHAVRRRRQHLGWRAPGRAGDRAGWRDHRHDPPAGNLRQRLLRRRPAQPPVHDGEPVALRGLREQRPGARRAWRGQETSP